MLKFLGYLDYFVAFANHHKFKIVSEKHVKQIWKRKEGTRGKWKKAKKAEREKKKVEREGEEKNKWRGQETRDRSRQETNINCMKGSFCWYNVDEVTAQTKQEHVYQEKKYLLGKTTSL